MVSEALEFQEHSSRVNPLLDSDNSGNNNSLFNEAFDWMQESSNGEIMATVAIGATLLATTKGRSALTSLMRMEEKNITTLAGGIRVKFSENSGSQIEKVLFADGKIAERTTSGRFKEYYRNGLFGNNRQSLHFEDYQISPKGLLQKTDETDVWTWNRDGSVSKDKNVGMFHTSNVSAGFVKEMYSTYLEIDEPLRDHLVRNGAQFHIGRNLVEMFPLLKDKPVRGWSSGSKWSDIGGVHYGSKSAVVESDNLNIAKQTFRHEMGHDVDRVLGISNSPEFSAAYNRDIANNISNLSSRELSSIEYFLQTPANSRFPGSGAGRKELVAETFNTLHGGLNDFTHILNQTFPESKGHIVSRLAPFRTSY
jgi:hypothetical protein